MRNRLQTHQPRGVVRHQTKEVAAATLSHRRSIFQHTEGGAVRSAAKRARNSGHAARCSPSARRSPCSPSTSAYAGRSAQRASAVAKQKRTTARAAVSASAAGRRQVPPGGPDGPGRRQPVLPSPVRREFCFGRRRWRRGLSVTHRTALPRPGGPLGLLATALDESVMVSGVARAAGRRGVLSYSQQSVSGTADTRRKRRREGRNRGIYRSVTCPVLPCVETAKPSSRMHSTVPLVWAGVASICGI